VTARPDPADALTLRLQYVVMRLEERAAAAPVTGLTEPDQPSGEQWEWGQVWAHLGEFIPYWMGQIAIVVAGDGSEPVAFGRTKADSERIAAIDRDRDRPASELWTRMRGQLADLWNLIDHLPEEDWDKRGLHPTLGVMDMARIFDEFLVGHLEQHAAQLDGLVAGQGG
jgi:hypothetical protein